MTTKASPQSPFGQAALALDGDFVLFERLSTELESLSLNSEKGLERARALLLQFGECGTRIGDGMQVLSTELMAAQQRTEKAAQLVSQKALEVQQRQGETEGLLTRFKTLGDMVKQVTTLVGQLKQPDADITPEQQQVLATRLPEINGQLGILVDEAKKLMDDAHKANLKTLESNADSLRQSLAATRHRLNQFVERHVAAAPAIH